jgi:hypothetical protein
MDASLDNIYGQLFASPAFIWSVVAILGLFVFITFTVIFQRARRPKGMDGLPGMTLNDVDSLKKKGLLTPEEAARVRTAVAKQVTTQMSARPSPFTPATLVADPDVQRLEALAQAKATAKAQDSRTADSASGDADSGPQARANTATSADDDVELPPDVLGMVQLGLITPEELARIRERARQKRRAAGL